jgi:hypothetical protein
MGTVRVDLRYGGTAPRPSTAIRPAQHRAGGISVSGLRSSYKDLDHPTLSPLEVLEGSTGRQDAEAKNWVLQRPAQALV